MAISLLLGGAIAGLAGCIQMLGDVQRYAPALTNQTGYTGVVIAVLAAGSPRGIILLSFVFAAITVGNNLLAVVGVSSFVQFALFGLILVVAAFGMGASRLRLVRTQSTMVKKGSPSADGGVPSVG